MTVKHHHRFRLGLVANRAARAAATKGCFHDTTFRSVVKR
jgi:hypothetical protein